MNAANCLRTTVFWHKSSGQRHVDGFRSDGSNVSMRLYLQEKVLAKGASCMHCRRVAVGALRRSGGAGLFRQRLLGLSGHAAGAGGGLPPGSGGRHADAAPRPVQVTTRLPATAGKPQRDACRHNALVLRRSGRNRRICCKSPCSDGDRRGRAAAAPRPVQFKK